MKRAFVVTCSCGSTVVSNQVELDDFGWGEMVTVCCSCQAEMKRTILSQECVEELLEEVC